MSQFNKTPNQDYFESSDYFKKVATSLANGQSFIVVDDNTGEIGARPSVGKGETLLTVEEAKTRVLQGAEVEGGVAYYIAGMDRYNRDKLSE